MEKLAVDEAESAEAVPGVHLTALVAGERMSLQEFRIEPEQEVPTHDHPHEQVGYVTRGELTFVVGDGEASTGSAREEILVQAGESYVIPGEEPHAAENRGDVPVEGIDVFSPPRTDPDWTE